MQSKKKRHRLTPLDWDKLVQTPSLNFNIMGQANRGSFPQSKDYGESFYELAPYHAQASSKRIHWTRWLRRGELTLKHYELFHQGKLWLLLDMTGSMQTGLQWEQARVCAAQIALATVKSGHQVQLLIERDEQCIVSLPCHRIDQVIEAFQLIESIEHERPKGLSSSLSDRELYFGHIKSHDYVICLSDALSTVSRTLQEAHHLKSTIQKKEQVQKKEQLISVLEQLGSALKAKQLVYICFVDLEADRPLAKHSLCSPELPQEVPYQALTPTQAEEVDHLLKEYRQSQQKLFLNAHQQSTWFEWQVEQSYELQIIELFYQLNQYSK